jgi:hypothetical protein
MACGAWSGQAAHPVRTGTYKLVFAKPIRTGGRAHSDRSSREIFLCMSGQRVSVSGHTGHEVTKP